MLIIGARLIIIVLCESSFYLHVLHWFVDVMASLEKFNDCSICSLRRRRFTFSRQATICYLHIIYHVGSILIQNWWLDVFDQCQMVKYWCHRIRNQVHIYYGNSLLLSSAFICCFSFLFLFFHVPFSP